MPDLQNYNGSRRFEQSPGNLYIPLVEWQCCCHAVEWPCCIYRFGLWYIRANVSRSKSQSQNCDQNLRTGAGAFLKPYHSQFQHNFSQITVHTTSHESMGDFSVRPSAKGRSISSGFNTARFSLIRASFSWYSIFIRASQSDHPQVARLFRVECLGWWRFNFCGEAPVCGLTHRLGRPRPKISRYASLIQRNLHEAARDN